MFNEICKPLVVVLRYIVLWMNKYELKQCKKGTTSCDKRRIQELEDEILMIETTIDIERG